MLGAGSPLPSSQGLAWRMSHPLGTGNCGTPITPAGGGGGCRREEGVAILL